MNLENNPKQILKNLLLTSFSGLILRSPLFYRHSFGLRFDLEIGYSNYEEYFSTGIQRAREIFNKVFEGSARLIVCVQEFKYKPRRRLRVNSFLLRELKPITAQYLKVKNLYEQGQIHNSIVCEIDPNVSNIDFVLREIQEKDFYYRMRRRRRFGKTFGSEVYFLDVKRKLIYYMYDSRGVDVVASCMEDLLSLYQDLNEWILEYDRDAIDNKIKKLHGTEQVKKV